MDAEKGEEKEKDEDDDTAEEGEDDDKDDEGCGRKRSKKKIEDDVKKCISDGDREKCEHRRLGRRRREKQRINGE